MRLRRSKIHRDIESKQRREVKTGENGSFDIQSTFGIENGKKIKRRHETEIALNI